MRRALTTIRRLLWAIFHASQRPFMVNGHRDTPLLLLFLLINVLMSINVVLHHPMIGYDAVAHLRYVQALAEFRLPTAADTKEFFLPPLPYVLGAIAHHFIAPWCTAAGIGEGWGITAIPPCLVVAGKVAQLQNIPLSLGTTWGLVAISHLFAPNDVGYKRVVLGALGMLPVYYKTFAFVRGEPFLVCITVLVLLFTLRLLLNRPTSNRWRYILLLGAMLGLLLLSRQWGFFFLPPLGWLAVRWLLDRWQLPDRFAMAYIVGGAGIVAALIGGWFYMSLHLRYGTITAFNRQPEEHFSLGNQPLSFYTGLGGEAFIRHPIRLSFANELVPVFLSEVWGDYWCYFSVTGCAPRRGFDDRISNVETMAPYLGMVNMAALIPTLFGCMALLMGVKAVVDDTYTAFTPLQRQKKKQDGNDNAHGVVKTVVKTVVNGSDSMTHPISPPTRTLALAFLTLIILTSLAGYLWFLISYPVPHKGDTIKATYMLQIFPPLALLCGELWRALAARNPLMAKSMAGAGVAIFLLCMPIMVTRYVFLP